jgi:hypothetical protein
MARREIEDVARLKPLVKRLALLDGTELWLEEGLHLAFVERVKDATALASRPGRDLPPAAAVAKAVELSRPLERIDGAWLAQAHRGLKLLEGQPRRLALARTSRVLRKLAEVDEPWLRRRLARIRALSAALRAGPPPARAGLRPAHLALVRAAHGEAAAVALLGAARRSAACQRPAGSRADAPGELALRLARLEELALVFPPDDALVLSPERFAALPADQAVLSDLASVEPRLPASAALRLAELGRTLALPRHAASGLGQLVAGGLPLEEVERAAAAGLAAELAQVEEVAVARAWLLWADRLLPAARRAGLEPSLPAARFARAGRGRGPELIALWHVLLAHRRAAAPDVRAAIASLDAVLALFASGAAAGEALAAALSGTAPGEGRRLYPELARWTGREDLLDRLLHLQALAGESPRLSRLVLADHEASRRAEGQIGHLAALPRPTPAQAHRLAALRAARARGPGRSPSRTVRRLERAVGEAERRVFRAQVERLALDVLRRRIGVAPAALDDAWLDALRLLDSARENEGLLRLLLAAAAARPGEPLHERPANRAWAARARAAGLAPDAWLAHREREVHVGGEVHRLATEEDPLQILRMGVPFGTCLSLGEEDGEPGVNAASTVVNALDANKRVLYLRNARGAVVGRKLVAISSRWELVGYRTYLALDGARAPAADAAILELCRDLSRATGAPLAGEGVPEQLHAGFWWDDGTVPFEPAAPHDAAARFCAHLGLPGSAPDWLRLEAGAWAARERGDAPAVLRELDHADRIGPFWAGLAGWVREQLGRDALRRRGRRDCNAREPLFLEAARRSQRAVIEVLAACRIDPCGFAQASGWLRAMPPERGAAAAWIALVGRLGAPRLAHPAHPAVGTTLAVLPWLARGEAAPGPVRDAGLRLLRRLMARRTAEERGQVAGALERAFRLALEEAAATRERLGLWDDPVSGPESRAAVARWVAERGGPPREPRHRLELLRLEALATGRDPSAVEHETLRALLGEALREPLLLDWVAREPDPGVAPALCEAALAEGAPAAVLLLGHLPDAATAAGLARRIDRRALQAAPEGGPYPERYGWLRAALPA